MNQSRISEGLEVWHRYRSVNGLAFAVLVLACYAWSWYLSRKKKLNSSPAIKPTSLQALQKQHSLSNEASKQVGKVLPTTSSLDQLQQVESTNFRSAGRPAKRVYGSKAEKNKTKCDYNDSRIQPLIFYFSVTDSTRKYAEVDLQHIFDGEVSNASLLKPIFYDIATIDHEDFFEREPRLDATEKDVKYFYLLLIPSYNIDTALDNFLILLKETHNDFRIETAPLAGLAGYSVFGFGDSEGWPTVTDGYCSQSIEADKWMAKLTANKRAYPLGLGDVKSDATTKLKEWALGIINAMNDISQNGNLGEGVPGSGEALESDEEEPADLEQAALDKRNLKKRLVTINDLEDIGGKRKTKSPLPIDFTTSQDPQAPKHMVPVTSPTHAALTKQGYTIIGTHSGVKICRWTKSALRGRGSCYKYSFYGIKSHLCMETTPSLSCSNKCVFCWRHGTNPVGTTWRWQVDPPDLIFKGAKEGHYQKIKMMRGVPGVRAERFQEAMKIRHCALSLVGEPIFYPHINEFLALIHKERISSFLVCNAQHPDHLAALKSVTQLYVSIDASNAESLRKIDRPLYRDYWQRFLRCLDILRERRFQMRTVFRLTLVKGFNIDEEVEGYADLVARGLPCFVEIKGVTYCGTSTSKSAGLTMQNVPFYEEIVAFVVALDKALQRRGLQYGIAAEHAHSCCVLIASRRFFVEGKWHTLIDYEKYFECLEGGEEFSPEDYMGPPTPEWANWGNGGFDPRDERVDRKGRAIKVS